MGKPSVTNELCKAPLPKCHGKSNESNEKEGSGARAGPRGHESNEKEAEGNESSEEEVNRPRKDAENVLRPPNVQTMYHICFNKRVVLGMTFCVPTSISC